MSQSCRVLRFVTSWIPAISSIARISRGLRFIQFTASSGSMTVLKTKYALWAKDWQRAVAFYRDLFGGKVTMEMEVWSEIEVANGIIGIHGGGEGKRTWTGLSFQVDDLRSAIDELQKHGGSLTREPTDTPEDPLHLAMCIDPEGNEFMMTQSRR